MTIGIVGLGHLGKIHLKLLHEITEFKIGAVYDINKASLSDLSFQYQIPSAKNYDDLLNSVEAVSIVTPTPTHFELASKAIKFGKHVFIEKPATLHLEETQMLIKLAREAGVIVQVGHVERFNPAYIAAKEHIKNPYLFEVHRLANYNIRGTDVSVVLDLMIHDIDLILSLVKSKVKRILATGQSIVSNSADIANARVEFENGCVANLTANRIALHNIRKVEVYQKNSSVHIDLLNKTTHITSISPLKLNHSTNTIIDTGNAKYEISITNPITHPINAIQTEFTDFYKSITKNTPISVSLNDAEAALAIAKEIEAQIG
jgi:predicted dehydrogenase